MSDRYELMRLLGRGGFGEVYLARRQGADGLRSLVAIKVLRADIHVPAELERRIRDEGQILAMLRHRAIVRADRLIRVDGRCGIVMEYCEGVSLERLIDHAPLPLGAALELVAEVARALHACSLASDPDGRPLSLVHRDIKPSNLLITAHGEVRVLDFGIAQADHAGQEAETSAILVGTFGYMAPERFELRCGPEADVYALGVVQYEALARRCFGRTSGNRERHEQHLDERLKVLTTLRPELGPEFVALLQHMLAFRPNMRPTAGELASRLEDLARTAQGPGIVRWAQQQVGPLQRRAENGDVADFAGRILEVDRTPEPIVAGGEPSRGERPNRAPEARTGARRRLGVALGGAALTLGICAGGLVADLSRSSAYAVLPAPAPHPVPAPDAVPAPLALPPPAPVSAAAPPLETSAPPPRHRRRAGVEACPSGQLRVSANVHDVEIGSGGSWTALPACVPWSPLFKLRRQGGAEDASLGTFTVSSDRSFLQLNCHDQSCDPDYGG